MYEAWVPANLMSGYATITYIDNKAYGRIGTCRIQNYQEQYEEGYEAGYEAIIAKYPELIDAKRYNGRIKICE